MSTFFQAGLLLGMLQGVYDGDINFKTLTEHGDTGLGTLNGVDGEMIAVDGQFYRINVDGEVNLIEPTALTPFSVVTKFAPSIAFPIGKIASVSELSLLLDKHLPTLNIFYILRIDGEFSYIKLRSESCQASPIKPLAEALPKLQKVFELQNSTGTLVVTRCPGYSAGFTIPGYHYHYIDAARKSGGHVFELAVQNAKVSVTPLRNFNLVLFNNKFFDAADLQMDVHAALKRTE